MRLPIGIQDFPTLRENNYVYVDKTQLMKSMCSTGQTVFLSRPRRFGKSLLLSTIESMYRGQKDLFKDLWLFSNHDFVEHPVIRLDFSNINFTSTSLDVGIVDWLRIVGLQYQFQIKSSNARDAFRELILELSQASKVVILIDEYDKPITDYLLEPEKRDLHQAVLKSVYGLLKPLNAYLEFVILTGVSKIGKLSLFSDLNNLRDISLDPEFALLCGYTRQEIAVHFQPEIEALRVAQNVSLEVLWSQITYWYNGYSWNGKERLYCPFSFLVFLSQKEFRSFWFETGTPTFLVQLIRQGQLNPFSFEQCFTDAQAISSMDVSRIDPISLMFQTGYLTITQVQNSVLGTRYTLSYPNQEVRLAFSNSLLLEYSQKLPSQITSFALALQDALIALDWESFFAVCNQVLSSVPYEIFPKREAYIHSLMHLMLTSTGFQTSSQVQTSLGRMDTLVQTFTHSIIFEFKLGGSPQAALEQIDRGRYKDSLVKPVVCLGVVFELEQKQITAWKAQ